MERLSGQTGSITSRTPHSIHPQSNARFRAETAQKSPENAQLLSDFLVLQWLELRVSASNSSKHNKSADLYWRDRPSPRPSFAAVGRLSLACHPQRSPGSICAIFLGDYVPDKCLERTAMFQRKPQNCLLHPTCTLRPAHILRRESQCPNLSRKEGHSQ